MKLYHHKFRAECEADVDEFIKLLPKDYSHTVKVMRPDPLFPDVIVDIITPLTVPQLENLMRQITDGHVMLQTVAPLDHYTGDRDYNKT